MRHRPLMSVAQGDGPFGQRSMALRHLRRVAKWAIDARRPHHERVLKGSEGAVAGGGGPGRAQGADRAGLRRLACDRRALVEAAPSISRTPEEGRTLWRQPEGNPEATPEERRELWGRGAASCFVARLIAGLLADRGGLLQAQGAAPQGPSPHKRGALVEAIGRALDAVSERKIRGRSAHRGRVARSLREPL